MTFHLPAIVVVIVVLSFAALVVVQWAIIDGLKRRNRVGSKQIDIFWKCRKLIDDSPRLSYRGGVYDTLKKLIEADNERTE